MKSILHLDWIVQAVITQPYAIHWADRYVHRIDEKWWERNKYTESLITCTEVEITATVRLGGVNREIIDTIPGVSIVML